jgi:hypothetical protein
MCYAVNYSIIRGIGRALRLDVCKGSIRVTVLLTAGGVKGYFQVLFYTSNAIIN